MAGDLVRLTSNPQIALEKHFHPYENSESFRLAFLRDAKSTNIRFCGYLVNPEHQDGGSCARVGRYVIRRRACERLQVTSDARRVHLPAALADGVGTRCVLCLIAIHRILFGTRVTEHRPRARACATYRRAVAIAASVNPHERPTIQLHLALAAHRSVFLNVPQLFVATERRRTLRRAR